MTPHNGNELWADPMLPVSPLSSAAIKHFIIAQPGETEHSGVECIGEKGFVVAKRKGSGWILIYSFYPQ